MKKPINKLFSQSATGMGGLGFLILALAYFALKPHQLVTPAIPTAINKTLREASQKPQPLIEGVEFSEFKEGSKIFTLNAKALYLRNRKVEPMGFRVALGKDLELQDVNASFFLNGEPVSCIHSNTALFDKEKKNVTFQGRPFLLTKDHRALSADEIKWDSGAKVFRARGNCALSADGVSQRAEAITADINLNSFSIKQIIR